MRFVNAGFWGDAPTWIAAIGTVAAVSLALWEAGSERRRRVRQERRAQAENVSAWFDYANNDLVVSNESTQPVYEAVLSMVLMQGAGPRRGEDLHEGPGDHRRVFAVVPPGRWRAAGPIGWAGMSAHPGVEVAFTDHRATHWVRRAGGGIETIASAPIDYFVIGRPLSFQPLVPYTGELRPRDPI